MNHWAFKEVAIGLALGVSLTIGGLFVKGGIGVVLVASGLGIAIISLVTMILLFVRKKR